MGLFTPLSNIFNKEIVGGRFDLGTDSKTQTEDTKWPVFPEWFFNATLGQSRNIDFSEIRMFAKSAWVQMVLNTIKREISIIDYEILNKDEEDETDYSNYVKIIEDFFERCNTNKESIYDIMNPSVTDAGEIDSIAWVKQFTADSYVIESVPVIDSAGSVIKNQLRLNLKPFGQRKMIGLTYGDGATFLKWIDVYRRNLGYYQYSFKNPKSDPIYFSPDEISYGQMNTRSYSLYGFSPVQAIAQVLEVLIQSTRYNKDFFVNNAIPDGIIGLPNADPESMKRFKEMINTEFKGKPHKLLFHNTAAQFSSFRTTQRDMEWLDGQKWYMHLVFGIFGVSPVEAGFHENVNQGNTAGQERVTVRNAMKPYLKLFENMINKDIIPELLQIEKPPIVFRFTPKDHVEEQIEFDQSMRELQAKTLTINEYRKMRGRDPVEWGDDPVEQQLSMMSQNSQLNSNSDAEKQQDKESQQKVMIPYSTVFEKFMRQNDSHSR